jgi:hypothetical protein
VIVARTTTEQSTCEGRRNAARRTRLRRDTGTGCVIQGARVIVAASPRDEPGSQQRACDDQAADDERNRAGHGTEQIRAKET